MLLNHGETPLDYRHPVFGGHLSRSYIYINSCSTVKPHLATNLLQCATSMKPRSISYNISLIYFLLTWPPH